MRGDQFEKKNQRMKIKKMHEFPFEQCKSALDLGKRKGPDISLNFKSDH